MSTSGGAGASGILTGTAHLTGAQIAALNATPVTIVAAPGANKAIAIVSATYEMVVGESDYTATGIGSLFYNAPAAATLVLTLPFGGFGPQNGGSGLWALGPSNTPHPPELVAAASAINMPVKIGCLTAVSRAAGVATATIANGGAGYVVNDTGTLSGAGAADATYRVTTIGAAGTVTAFTITAGGTDYDTASNPVSTSTGGSQPGIGTGFTVNVATITAADGDLYVTTEYRVITTH